MSKKLLTFSMFDDSQKNFAEVKPLNFAFNDGGIRTDMCIFSTVMNRNRCFFQVADFLKYESKLSAILFNFNHDTSLTGGKYLGNKSKFTKMWSVMNNGDFEIWATFESTDPAVIEQKDNITAPSVEVMVDVESAIINENGEYYQSWDFQGCALLLGIHAGIGGARLDNMVEFDNKQESAKDDDTMTEEQMETIKNFIAEKVGEVETNLLKKFEEVQTEQTAPAEPVVAEPVTAEEVKPTEESAPAEVTEAEAQVEMALDSANKISQKKAEFSKMEKVSSLADAEKSTSEAEIKKSILNKLNLL